MITDESVTYYVSPLLRNAGVPHAFSTRLGGVSPRPFDSLNLGNPSGVELQDDPDRISENYHRLQRAIGCENRRRCFAHQVHGGDVLHVSGQGEPFQNGQCADALISDDATKLLAIRTADCVPILVATSDGARVAAIHAGWRGIVAGVIGNAIGSLLKMKRDETGEIRSMQSRDLVAAIGPCIGFDAFEVGPEVLTEFTRLFGASTPIRHEASGKGRVDLSQAARLQLLGAGMRSENIDMTDRCTYRDVEEFFSHRRDRGITGRMAALIGPATSKR